MSQTRYIIVFLLSLFSFIDLKGQRNYAPNSVLSSGTWLKISADSAGIFKVSAELLKKGGITTPINSSTIRLFGNGGNVLPEANHVQVVDDLAENSILLFDGDDGKFEGQDYFLFYNSGPESWFFDSSLSKFQYRKNPYSNVAYYYVTVGNDSGKRIIASALLVDPKDTVSEFIDYYHYEKDQINFLKSGKEWYGEEFNAQSGVLEKKIIVPLTNLIPGSNFIFKSEVIGRSSLQSNLVSVSINGNLLASHTTLPVNASLIDPVASVSTLAQTEAINTSSMEVNYKFSPGSINAKAWLNYFEVEAKRALDMSGLPQLEFNRVSKLSGNNSISYAIKNPSSSLGIWDVSAIHTPLSIRVVITNGIARFSGRDSGVHKYIAFNPAATKVPKLVGIVKNQNLHAQQSTDMIIITDKAFVAQAERLASFHRMHNRLSVTVTEVSMVFNEFSSGSTDPTAIRNYVKMFYDRAGSEIRIMPKYLLLFGSASYVFKEETGSEKNKLPSYQSQSSLDPLTSYVTDDYYGFLDDSDDINNNLLIPQLDIGIGRIPARTVAQAKYAIDKIISYHEPTGFGSWRNEIALIADDEDYNIHLNDAEYHALEIIEKATEINLNKIYLDAFEQESGVAGNRYPEVIKQINKGINNGLLILNYSGHGGSARLAQESILDKTVISNWNNANKLPLFITATCDFAPFDDPSQFSLGEELLLGGSNGAIGLLTTTRLVFASSNRIINNNYFKFSLKRDSLGKYPSLGIALKEAKNFTVSSSGDYINARKFVLLGDPAMKLAMPDYGVKSTSINGKLFSSSADTLKALNKYQITGIVTKPGGTVAEDFNGFVYPVVYDKPMLVKTRGNDPQSIKVGFQSQQNVLYKGKVKVEKGRFTYDFIIPKDIEPEYGSSKISYYAENGIYDAAGADTELLTGGTGLLEKSDGFGPLLECYLDDSTFKNGKTVGQNPKLYVKINDASGINFSQLGIGHEMTATLDQDFRKTYFLNEFYKPIASGLTKGSITYPLPLIPEGNHQLEVRAWDVFNNSGTCKLEFKVLAEKKTNILSFGCYPNPVLNQATFNFSVTGLRGPAEVEIQIFTALGQQVKGIKKSLNLQADLVYEIVWDGFDSENASLESGLYYSKLFVKNSMGETQQKVLKIIKF